MRRSGSRGRSSLPQSYPSPRKSASSFNIVTTSCASNQRVLAQGFTLNLVLRTIFASRNADWKVVAVFTTSVHDSLSGHLAEGEAAVQNTLDRFQAGSVDSGRFRF